MKIRILKKLSPALLLLTLSTSAMAHTNNGTTQDFIDGFMHPWQGIDHLLVMFAIGLWAAVLSGKSLWQLPLSFLLAMAAGAGIHFAGYTIAFAEQWVALSVIAAGFCLWRNWQTSSVWASGLVALFALSHGYVHAAETVSGADQLGYASGFLLTTAILHGLGLTVGLLKPYFVKTIRISYGLFCATVGIILLAV